MHSEGRGRELLSVFREGHKLYSSALNFPKVNANKVLAAVTPQSGVVSALSAC